MSRLTRPLGALVLLLSIWTFPAPVRTAEGADPAAAGPDGQMVWAVPVTLAPRWLDPGETESAIPRFMVLYAIHDALWKPMPAGLNTPSLAESWSMSPDGTSYEFVLRQGAKFHNGDPVTAEDVKFSFERYRGGAAKLLKDKVKDVQVVDARRVRFQLKEPWPDFMTFVGTTATGVGWIVPKKYVERVGDEGFKKVPVGAGPGARRALPSIGRRSTRPSSSASRARPGTSSPGTWSSRSPSTRTPTIRCAPSSSWARPGTRTASTAATSRPTRPTTPWRRRSPATWAPSGSGRVSGRWSAPLSYRRGGRRSSAASCWARRARAETRRPASRGSRRGPGGTRTASSPRSKTSSIARPERSIGRSGRSSSTRSSGSSTSAWCSRRSGRTGSFAAWDRGWRSRASP